MEPTKNSTVDEFFNTLPSEDKKEADIFTDKKEEKPTETPVKDDDEAEESVKNRRHRRLEEKLQRERESNIALAERLKVLSEQDKFVKESDGEIDPDIARMFDTTDIGKENALRLSKKLQQIETNAEERALNRIQEARDSELQEQRQYESLIDNQLESLEDQYNVDLTSDSPKARKTRREFLEMVQSLSPKDEDGTITGYVDFGSTFDLYQKTREEAKPDASRNKEIASKSMQRPTSSGEAPTFEGPMTFARAKNEISKYLNS